jgi:hypothetical protein
MKGKVMRPFRPPREAVQQDKPDRTITDTTEFEQESEEATELGLVYGPWIVKETQDAIQPHDEQHRRCNSPNVHVTSTELTSPSLSEFESYLEARESSVNKRQAMEESERHDIAAGYATYPPLP